MGLPPVDLDRPAGLVFNQYLLDAEEPCCSTPVSGSCSRW
jgi:hypothetical protein